MLRPGRFPIRLRKRNLKLSAACFCTRNTTAIQGSEESILHAVQTVCRTREHSGHASCHSIAPRPSSNWFSPQPKRRYLMPIDQTVRGLALEIDASTDPAPEAQPLLEYRFIDLASTQTILARIKGIPQPSGGGQLGFETNAGATTTSQRMLIDHNGNVGIGTGNPGARLDVAGDAKFSGPLSIQGALRVEGIAQIGGDLSVTGKLTAASLAGDAAGLSNVPPADSSVTNAKLAADAASLSKVSNRMMIANEANIG